MHLIRNFHIFFLEKISIFQLSFINFGNQLASLQKMRFPNPYKLEGTITPFWFYRLQKLKNVSGPFASSGAGFNLDDFIKMARLIDTAENTE